MKQLIAAILAVQLVFPVWAAAQTQAPPPSGNAPQQPAMLPGSLKVLILEGQGAINSIGKELATPPVVEIRDLDDRPMEAATVVFRLPPTGPSGFFPGRQLSKTMMTTVQGQAIASGLVPNHITGRFKIHVTATAGARMGEADIVQTNTPNQFAAAYESRHHKLTWWKWAIIGGAAAGATIGIILATRGGGSTPASSNPTVTITPGPITIGGR
jgi:hypothetical protein